MKLFFAGIALCLVTILNAQNNFKLIIRSQSHTLPGATVVWKDQNKTFFADSMGMILIPNVADGKQTFTISHVGFETKESSYTFPMAFAALSEIILNEEEADEDEVIITATRTSRTIANTPTRVEVISGEELDEKGNMKPGDIRMLLNESTGIQTQQTSATSYNSSIRIQGLDGRYTQILKDGLPLYAGFSGGLSLMQIVPLDLKQVEVIKGSSSTLYGGGAIAGLVNLVSQTPGKKKELNFLSNVTSANGFDLSAYYSQRWNKTGITIFGSYNRNNPYDPADIGLTAIPKFRRYTINPRVFLYGKNTNAIFGLSYITEKRIGGSMDYIKEGISGYFEKDTTHRFTVHMTIDQRLNEHSSLNFKSSYTYFKRNISLPFYSFSGDQQSSFSEISFNHKKEKTQWVIGSNLITDDFNEDKRSNLIRDYHYNTYGLFIQNTCEIGSIFSLESGLRGDYVKQYGFELLPRISALFKINSQLTSRVGGGMGYKTPTVFTEEAEKIQFQQILPINEQATQNERSIGGNWDINYKTPIGKINLSINQLFFYTRINKPLIITTTGTGDLQFQNAYGHIDTKGFETNIKLIYNNFKLFIGYTHVNAYTHFNSNKAILPLTAKHRLNNVLLYEIEGKLKLGLEAYYFSQQRLSDNSTGKAYWITGFMLEKIWDHFSLFINFENFTDTRQTKFDNIYSGSVNNPVFKDIYAPVDGFVINGGIKIRI